MKPKYTLIVAFFLALVVGALAPVSASARHRVHVYFSYGTTPSYYYYQPAPAYYYQPETTYYYRPYRYRYYRWEEREHWRRYHRDRGWHRGWDRDRDGD